MNQFVQNLKTAAQENPLAAIAIGALALTATAKLIRAHGEAAGSRAYARQINHKLNASR